MFAGHAEVFRPGARIIYRTGWDRKFGTPEFFAEFPTLTLEAARWIAERGICMLGMDTPTPSTDWKECHLILLKKGAHLPLPIPMSQVISYSEPNEAECIKRIQTAIRQRTGIEEPETDVCYVCNEKFQASERMVVCTNCRARYHTHDCDWQGQCSRCGGNRYISL